MASILAILDSNSSCLISRTYSNKELIPFKDIIDNFYKHRKVSKEPIFQYQNVNYLYIVSNELILLCVCYNDHTNIMTLFQILYKLNDILKIYFKVDELDKDLILDHINLIYELFDELLDFGIPQLTDISILKDVIKLDKNEDDDEENDNDEKKNDDQYINSSVLRASTQTISWRPKGIFYSKNEIFIDVLEKITLIVDSNDKIINHSINGNVKIKSFLSGMPSCSIGLSSHFKKFNHLNFNQCVSMDEFETNELIRFVPPDGEFELCSYHLNLQTIPIIQIKAHDFTIINNSLQIYIKLKTNFTKRSNLFNLNVLIPIDLSKYDINFTKTPKFKTKIGKVSYKFDQDCIIWSIDTIGGDREYEMFAKFKLRKDDDDDEKKEVKPLGMDPPKLSNRLKFDKIMNQIDDEDRIKSLNHIKIEFELDLSISNLKIEFLKIEEDVLQYTSFPWVRYKTNNDEYVYRL